jgi:hypothetical protein
MYSSDWSMRILCDNVAGWSDSVMNQLSFINDTLNQLVQSDTVAPDQISSPFISSFNWEYILNVFPLSLQLTLEPH